jgi:hypothetical protein
MANVEDAFSESFRLSIAEDSIAIAKKSTGILQIIISLIVVTFLLILIATGGNLLGNFFLFLIACLAGYMGYQAFVFNKYHITIIDIESQAIEKLSKFFFIKPITYSFQEIENISIDVVETGGHTSAYEEGNTSYEKTVILETKQGEIPLLNYSSRSEEAEESLMMFISALKDKGILPISGDYIK